jgi:transketolase
MSPTSAISTAELAKRIRRRSLVMTSEANASHIASALSIADILAVLYGRILRFDARRPDWPERDRFILSKGHACCALYSVLAECGFFAEEWLRTYYQNGGHLPGHATHKGIPGIEVSTGSLGHGLSLGTGMALAAKRAGKPQRVFVVLGDGECNEGSIWEAALLAPHHHLDNLAVIVDSNKMQSLGSVSEVIDLAPLADKWRAMGWATSQIDGHDLARLEETFNSIPFQAGRPSCVIADTVKGKGVSFMENKLQYHYAPPRGDELPRALAEVEAS